MECPLSRRILIPMTEVETGLMTYISRPIQPSQTLLQPPLNTWPFMLVESISWSVRSEESARSLYMNGPVQPTLPVSVLVKPQGLGKTRELVVSELEISLPMAPVIFPGFPRQLGDLRPARPPLLPNPAILAECSKCSSWSRRRNGLKNQSNHPSQRYSGLISLSAACKGFIPVICVNGARSLWLVSARLLSPLIQR